MTRRGTRAATVRVAGALCLVAAALAGAGGRAAAVERPSAPPAGPRAATPGGYWTVGVKGTVSAFGDAPDLGSVHGALDAPVVGMASTVDGKGYWLVSGDGGVFSFGDAAFYGSMAAAHLNRAVVGIAAAPGGGYWLVAADGGIFAFGPGAAFAGSMGGRHLDAPVVGMAAAPGGGYLEVAADGGVFAFGDAGFFGSMGGTRLDAPVVAVTPVARGGYLEAAADGGIFAFGPGAAFAGSMGGRRLVSPVVGMAAVTGGGYVMTASDGGVFAFGGVPFAGSLGGSGATGVVAVAVPSPTTLPVSHFVEPGGIQRAVVQVSVAGGPPVPMVLDTGSTGLHIYTSAVGTDGLTPVGPDSTETYGGVQYTGPIDAAPISVGGIASVGPVEFMDVQGVQCIPGDSCPSPTPAALVANGIYGTIGVSLSSFPAGSAQAGLYSPLLQLPGGSSGFTIAFADASSGTVTLGAGAPAAGSAVLPLTAKSPATNANGSGAWDVASARVCWSVGGAAPTCAPGGTTFDTGTPSPGVQASELPAVPPNDGTDLDAGQTVALRAPGAAAPFWSYTTGTTPDTRTSVNAPAGADLLGTAGLPIYFSCAVTYDAARGEVVVTPDGAVGG